jgi:hypothetical protein
MNSVGWFGSAIKRVGNSVIVFLTLLLTHAADGAATLYGGLPRDPIRILVERSDNAGEPVFSAQVLRQKPQGIQFWVNTTFALEAFLQDWTAVHELVHLYIPYPGDADIWLSEGLATYYQNILRTRTGVLSEKQAWQNFYNGFMRGQVDAGYSTLSTRIFTVQRAIWIA